MKYCDAYAALLDPFIDGELSPEENARVQAHLENCDGCRHYVETALSIREFFPDGEEAEVPPAFAEGVMAAIRADAAPRKKRRSPWAKVLLPLAACCAVVVLVRGLPFLSSQTSMSIVSGETAATDTVETAPAGDSGPSVFAAVQPEDDAAPDAASSAGDAPAAPSAEEDQAAPYKRNSEPESHGAEAPQDISESAPTAALTIGGETEPPAQNDTVSPGEGPAEGDLPAVSPVMTDQENTAAQTAKASVFAVVRIPADLAGELLSEHTPASDEEGVLHYELSGEEYDALTAALAAAGTAPEVLLSVPAYRETSGSLALVYISET